MTPGMDTDFYRIRRLPPYVFAEVNAMKAAARARGEDISLDIRGVDPLAAVAGLTAQAERLLRSPRAAQMAANLARAQLGCHRADRRAGRHR